MAYNIAHIKNGIVENVSVFNEVPPQNDINNQGMEFVDITDAPVGIGWEYADGVFSNTDFDYVWSKAAGKVDLVKPEAE